MSPAVSVRLFNTPVFPVAEILVSGNVLLRLRGSSASERASLLVDTLQRALLFGLSPDAIAVIKVKGGFQVTLSGQTLLVADRIEARRAKSLPASLANHWASQIRSVLSQPSLAVEATDCLVAVGETYRLTLLGSAKGPITVQIIPDHIAAAGSDEPSSTVYIKGVAPGRGRVIISRQNRSLQLPLRVAHRAVRVAQPPTAFVSGSTVPLRLLTEAVENALRLSLETRLGAEWAYDPPTVNGSIPGSLILRVRASGPDLLPFDQPIALSIRPFSQTPGDAKALVISNDPETFYEPGSLLQGSIAPSFTIRLLSHHRNGMNRTVHLALQIINASDVPTWISLRGSVSGPAQSELSVGHIATRDYLTSLMSDSAIRLQIPPQTVYSLFPMAMGPGLTATHILDIRNEDGSQLFYRLMASPRPVPKVSPLEGSSLSDLFGINDYHARFVETTKEVEGTHRAGQRWTYISIGKDGIRHPDGIKRLQGNYGVIYRVRLHFVNETDRVHLATAEVEAAGGVARGALVVDGRLVQLPTLQSHQRWPLTSFELNPGERRTVSLVTLPAPGSFYPLHIIGRTDRKPTGGSQ
ncbi:MAG: hypothetical protein NZ959_10030 [Armatimonadetes bacterium]|nr:hypothetical protein [Armatimonadota bacterium]MDW8122821.1 hypothetical protein [Armatimonadota bacterium]